MDQLSDFYIVFRVTAFIRGILNELKIIVMHYESKI